MDHIADLVSSLRSSMRPLDAAYVPTDVATTIDDALRITAHRLPGVQVVRDIAEGLPDVTAHPGQLTQVWINLLTNAAKYTPERGHVARSVRRDGPDAVIEVRDDGIGIPAEALPSLFEMFS